MAEVWGLAAKPRLVATSTRIALPTTDLGH
jgi:hypothetical protein